MRKLVTIRQVTSIEAIPQADYIEAVYIDGWVCVCKKGEFKVNQLGIFHEIDSFIPIDQDRYKFLVNMETPRIFNTKLGVRLRTRRLRKIYSQGLLLPLSDFPELKNKKYDVGDDITDLVGVVLYEPPTNISLKANKYTKTNPFPYWIPKTEEERIQNLPHILDDKDSIWEVTEKLDGTSFTAFYGGPNNEFGVCSRNIHLIPYSPNMWDRLKTFFKNYNRMISRRWDFRFWKLLGQIDKTGTDNVYWKIAKQYKLDQFLPECGYKYALQGEIIGEGIQKNPYKLHGQELYIFNIYNIEKQEYLTAERRQAFIDFITIFGVNLKHVPILEHLSLGEFNSMKDILEYADKPSAINPKVNREGVVFKHLNNTDLSFKSINNRYLLKTEE